MGKKLVSLNVHKASIALFTAAITLFSGFPEAAHCDTVFVNFDDVSSTNTSGEPVAGSTFAAHGIALASCICPNSLSLGSTITLSGIDQRILLISNANSVSSPNLIGAMQGANGETSTNDILFSFAGPVSSIQVATDDSSETGQIVRLLALDPTENPWEFEVVGLAEGLDNATTSPANLLTINLGTNAFSFALFQVTTEYEGIDNLTYVPTPEPKQCLSVILPTAMFAVSLRKRLQRRRMPPMY
ncbi:MAG TPA: hypothetical protein PLU30_04585 [Verrucomicrobiae bacterium]|nr:hypothetical protein [Verrucomicrobiae bacterium]